MFTAFETIKNSAGSEIERITAIAEFTLDSGEEEIS